MKVNAHSTNKLGNLQWIPAVISYCNNYKFTRRSSKTTKQRQAPVPVQVPEILPRWRAAGNGNRRTHDTCPPVRPPTTMSARLCSSSAARFHQLWLASCRQTASIQLSRHPATFPVCPSILSSSPVRIRGNKAPPPCTVLPPPAAFSRRRRSPRRDRKWWPSRRTAKRRGNSVRWGDRWTALGKPWSVRAFDTWRQHGWEQVRHDRTTPAAAAVASHHRYK